MSRSGLLATIFFLSLTATASRAPARDLKELKVLYIGDHSTERGHAFALFLRSHTGTLQAVARDTFKPGDATSFDVVVLDWPQNISRFTGNKVEWIRPTPPLGDRATWTKPTVLLGSAGLNLAAAWEVQGGVGCTCLSPFAYGMRDHPVFKGPIPIDTTHLQPIPNTEAFREALGDPTTPMLPLVDDKGQKWKSGWCTYSDGFSDHPDIEVFCGGKNEKTPSAAACWRQGNLLHFGFEQSPAEMNDTGRRLLLNCIAYISAFTDDRPIASTPSAFFGAARSRASLDRRLGPGGSAAELQWFFTPQTMQVLQGKNPDQLGAWFAQNRGYLHPGAEAKLELDAQAVQAGYAVDKPEFFDRSIANLRKGGQHAQLAATLLSRYAPSEIAPAISPNEWSKWLEANRSFLFFSDQGDYRWYVDGLAKRRGVPSAQLRGSARATPVIGRADPQP